MPLIMFLFELKIWALSLLLTISIMQKYYINNYVQNGNSPSPCNIALQNR